MCGYKVMFEEVNKVYTLMSVINTGTNISFRDTKITDDSFVFDYLQAVTSTAMEYYINQQIELLKLNYYKGICFKENIFFIKIFAICEPSSIEMTILAMPNKTPQN